MFFTFLFFVLAIHAQTHEIYDLKRCLETGLERNYDIRIVRNEQQVNDNNFTVGNAGFLPSLTLNAGYSGSLNDRNDHYTDGTSNKINSIFNQATSVGLNLDWTVFDGFKMQTEYQRLREFKQKGEISTRLAIESLIAELTAEYYNYIHQNLRLANLKYAVELSKERLRIVEAHYSIGSKSRLDLQQARVDFNADSSKLIKQYEVVNTSAIVLNRLMAVDDVSQKIATQDSIIEPNILLDEQSLLEKTLATNSRLLIAAKDKELSKMDLKALKSRNYPYLKLNLGYGYTGNLYDAAEMNRQNTLGLSYGLTVGFSIFDGMNRSREQRNAKIMMQNNELQSEQLELSLKADLAGMWMAYRNNIDLTNLEKENLVVAHENYEIAMERYKLGDLSGLELREAQNSLLEAEERLLQAQYNTKLCEISLLQISGQITSYIG
ncbi:MAG: TolC family protein [Dysgonamonadaceae bacterium]|nr:TolC family protein [Dysgonamonadaceae bacterium]